MKRHELDTIQACAPEGHVLRGTWDYPNADGSLFGVMARYEPVTDGGRDKQFRPFVVEDGELVCKGFPEPRPLYNLDKLAARPDAPVLVVEGEKTADAAAELFPGYVVTTSPHGCKSASKADWSPLAGRDVVIWPDNDEAGTAYAMDVVKAVANALVVPISASQAFPPKWDLADPAPEGVTHEVLEGLLMMAGPAAAASSKKKKADKDDLRRTAEEVKRQRDAVKTRIKKLRNKTVAKGCTEAEAANAAAKVKELMAEYRITEEELNEDIGFDDVGPDDFGTEEALRASAAGIIASKDVLRNFAAAWRMMVAGEEKNAKLLYLVATSRLFDKPMHAAIKGPSSAGKSEIRKRVLSFFPPESILSFTVLSEKALLYFEKDFCHMVLSMGEASGIEEQKLQDYLLRELMSEGKLRYPRAVKVDGRIVTEVIEKNGPVSFMVTTTKHALHQENETRMLSVEVDDSADQTSAVLRKIAETEGLNQRIHSAQYIQWQDFQRWLARGNCTVTVPYAPILAQLIASSSVRLRRDFMQLLTAIKSHALIHREHRYIDEGEIVATLDDYAVVRELMSDIMAETSELKVKKTLLETVEAVRAIQPIAQEEGVTAQAVGKKLKLDKSAALRRLQSAQREGLIKNLTTRQFQPGSYRTVDVESDTRELLPTVEELSDAWCEKVADAA
jgi:predicted transcriptional regulator